VGRSCHPLDFLSSYVFISIKSSQSIPFQSNRANLVQTLTSEYMGTYLFRDSQHVISRDNLTQHAPGIVRPAVLICRYAEVRTKEFIAKIGRDARMPSNRNSLNICSMVSTASHHLLHSAKVQNSELHSAAAQQPNHDGASYRSSSGMRSGAEFHFLWKRETCYNSVASSSTRFMGSCRGT